VPVSGIVRVGALIGLLRRPHRDACVKRTLVSLLFEIAILVAPL